MTSNGWYPEAIKRPINTQEYWATRTAVLSAICDHITDGLDSRDFLQNADNGSSVHFLVRDEDGAGVVYQFMPVQWAAWGNGITSDNNPYMPLWIKQAVGQGVNPNMFSVSIEHERKWPFYTPPSAPMMEASIKLHQWLCDNYPTIKRDRGHIIGHYQIDHIRKANCPGGPGGALFPFDQILAALNTVPDPMPLIIVPEFRAFYNAEPRAMSYWGLPLEAAKQERLGDGKTYTVQYFERARFELHSTQVMLGLLGVEVLAK
jgi:hypothetical protein